METTPHHPLASAEEEVAPAMRRSASVWASPARQVRRKPSRLLTRRLCHRARSIRSAAAARFGRFALARETRAASAATTSSIERMPSISLLRSGIGMDSRLEGRGPPEVAGHEQEVTVACGARGSP